MLTHVSPWITTPLAFIFIYLFVRFMIWAHESGLLMFLFISAVIVVMLARGGPLIGMMP